MAVGSIISVMPRGAATAIAIIILIVSAVTIGIINDNKYLKIARDYHGPRQESYYYDEFVQFQRLIISTQNAASWLIFQSIVVAIVEVVAIVLYIFISQQTPRLIIGILDLIFIVLTALCYLGSSIATAIFTAVWSIPPELCDIAKDVCDAMPLTVTNGLEAVLCFIQIGVFIAVGVTAIIDMVRSARSGARSSGRNQAYDRQHMLDEV